MAVENTTSSNSQHQLGMQIRSEFNFNSPNSEQIRSQREFAADLA